MPRRDPLVVLARLRRFEHDQARQIFAAAEAGCASAAELLARAEAALDREAASLPADYAAWLPAARAAQTRAAHGVRTAEADAETARAELVTAGAAAEALAMLLDARRAAARRARLAAEHAALEDATGKLGGGGGLP
jgi:hypothetical protein